MTLNEIFKIAEKDIRVIFKEFGVKKDAQLALEICLSYWIGKTADKFIKDENL